MYYGKRNTYHFRERDTILIKLKNGVSLKEIAQKIDKDPTSISKEIKKIIDAVKAIPSDIVSLDEFYFKQIFPRVVIKRKNQIILIIENENIKENKKFITNPLFNTHIDYKVRKTMFTCKVGILINK